MVDEVKAEEVKEEPKEAKEEIIEKEEPEEKPQFDNSALEELKTKMTGFEEESKKDKTKLENVKKVLLGEDINADEEKDFYEKLTTKPKEAFEELIKKNIEPINKKFEEQQILEKDRIAFTNLRNIYSDFDEVIKDANRYLSKEDIEQTEGLSNRTEIRFNLARGRRELDLRSKKTQEVNAMNKAKEEINKTARTEVPAGGKVQETKTTEDARRERIEKYKGEWNSDKVLDEVMDGDYESILMAKLKKSYK